MAKSPLRWFGGKNQKTGFLLKFVPEHRIYVEPFGGSGALLFAKKPSEIEVYNDLDERLSNFFLVLKNDLLYKKFYEMCLLTPHSREEFNQIKNNTFEGEAVLKAWKLFVVSRKSMFARLNSFGFERIESTDGMSAVCNRYIKAVLRLPTAHERIKNIIVENLDFREVISKYDSENTFFYLDPPYVPETRKCGEYHHDMTEQDHIDMVKILLKIRGKVMLSGYPNRIYQELEINGWRRIDYSTFCGLTGRTRQKKLVGDELKIKQHRTESLWINYDISII